MKSLRAVLVAALLLIPTAASPQMFVTTGALSDIWTCGLSAIGATLTECKAVPAVATQKHYITSITVQTTTTTSGTYAIQSGTGTNCGTATTVVFPKSGSGSDRWNAPITTQSASNYNFFQPIPITAGHAICHIGVGTNTTSILIIGFTR